MKHGLLVPTYVQDRPYIRRLGCHRTSISMPTALRQSRSAFARSWKPSVQRMLRRRQSWRQPGRRLRAWRPLTNAQVRAALPPARCGYTDQDGHSSIHISVMCMLHNSSTMRPIMAAAPPSAWLPEYLTGEMIQHLLPTRELSLWNWSTGWRTRMGRPRESGTWRSRRLSCPPSPWCAVLSLLCSNKAAQRQVPPCKAYRPPPYILS